VKRIRAEILILEAGDVKPVETWVTDGLMALDADRKLWIFVDGAWSTLFESLVSGDPSSGDAATWDGSDTAWAAN